MRDMVFIKDDKNRIVEVQRKGDEFNKGKIAIVDWQNKNVDIDYYNQIIESLCSLRDVGGEPLPEFYDVAAQQAIEGAVAGQQSLMFWAVGKKDGEWSLWKVPQDGINSWKEQRKIEDLKLIPKEVTYGQIALAFNGVWDNSLNKDYKTFITEEQPYLFVIIEGNLFQYEQEKHSIKQINNVELGNLKFVSAERGFGKLGATANDEDQGLIVMLSTKSNRIFYQSYVQQVSNNEYMWEFTEEDINTANHSQEIKKMQLHRLNDYKMGVCVTKESVTDWQITKSEYAGMTLKNEYFDIQPKKMNLLYIGMTDYPASIIQPNWDWQISSDNSYVILRSDLVLETLENAPLLSNFYCSSTTGYNLGISSVTFLNNKTIKIIFDTPARTTFTLNIRGSNIRFRCLLTQEQENRIGYHAVAINAASHTFVIKQERTYTERFDIQPKVLDYVTIEMEMPQKIDKEYAEMFEIQPKKLDSVIIQMKMSQKTEKEYTEKFEIQPKKLNSVTIQMEWNDNTST